MNVQNLVVDTREFKTVEFSSVQIGKTFYSRRPPIGTDQGKLIKLETQKTSNGAWTNAKATYGLKANFFIKYDSKVVIEK